MEQKTLTGITVFPLSYQLGMIEDGAEKFLSITFWMTPDRSDPKPLNIVLGAEAVSELLINMTGALTTLITTQGPLNDKQGKNDGGQPAGRFLLESS